MPSPIAQPVPNGKPGRDPVIRADPFREYAAGGQRLVHTPGLLQALPRTMDDLTQDFGDDIYERMLFDSQVAACVYTLKHGILAQKPEVSPARKEGEEGYELAQEIAEFCKRCLQRLPHLRTHTLHNMLDALYLGHRLAELVYEVPETGEDAGKIVLKAVKVKPRRMTALVVDTFLNVVGVLAVIPGKSETLSGGSAFTAKDMPNLLPRRKFALLTFRPRNEDPRGQSLLRPIYNAWWLKMQVWPEFRNYLSQFAGASVWGAVSEKATLVPKLDADGQPVLDAEGNPVMVTPVNALLENLLQWRNGTALAVPFGTEIQTVPPQGNGEAFNSAIRLLNREITVGILNQELATGEGQRQSRAASEVHMQTLAKLLGFGRTLLEEMIENDLWAPLIEYNWGLDALQYLPNCSLGDVEQADFATMASAVGFLVQSGYLAPSQLQEIDAQLGLPVRTQEEVETYVPLNEPGAAGEDEDTQEQRASERRSRRTRSPAGAGAANAP